MFFKSSQKLQSKIILNTHCLRGGYAGCEIFVSTPNSKLRHYHSSADYQFIQQCSLPTLYFQKSLPRLPIPELKSTQERYLNALKPLLSESQFEKTKAVVAKFGDSAQCLQQALKEKDLANAHTSYISQPWFDMYLKDRSPLPLNYNPGISFKRSSHTESETQLCKATNMTISSLRFMKSLQNNLLAPEVMHMNPEKTDTQTFHTFMKLLPRRYASYGAYFVKAYPLDMSQYSSLFSSTRIPQEHKDILVKDKSGKHILVLRKGHFFLVDVLDAAGDILPPEDIYTCFKHILSKDLSLDTNSLGVLTAENRDVWARARQHLVSIHPDNFQSIKAIDSALFVVCLDDKPTTGRVDAMRTFLHGDGYNRWFDKSFSLIFAGDGEAAINFEHSWGDGVAVLRYIKDIYADINNKPFVNSATEASKVTPKKLIRKLEFNYDDKVYSDVKTAKENFDKMCGSLAISPVECEGIGRNLCKKSQLSPDAFMQLSFQIAYHRVYGNFVSTYESCSTATFKHGRTETLRPCTEATKKCALGFNGKNKLGNSELYQLIMECSDTHKSLMKDALMGQGFDRHLFGLKHTSEELGRPLPELYTDEAYKLINYNILSTSTLAADEVDVGGFGPVVPDGLGVGYTILDNYCGSIVSSYPAKRNGADFAEALRSVFNELSAVLSSN